MIIMETLLQYWEGSHDLYVIYVGNYDYVEYHNKHCVITTSETLRTFTHVRCYLRVTHLTMFEY